MAISRETYCKRKKCVGKSPQKCEQLEEENKRLKDMLNLKYNGHDVDCRRYKYGNNYECTCGRSVKP